MPTLIPVPALRHLPTLALLVVGAVTVAFFCLAHEGIYALDDYLYAQYAQQLLHGTFELGPDPHKVLHDPLHERWLIFGPVAGFFSVFGHSIISATLWPLLATLGCAGLIWWAYRHRHPVAAGATMLLLGLHYFTLDLTRYLYPDNILMFWCLASALALLRGREPGRRGQGWGAGFALLSFAALLSKETITYYAPFYLLVLGRDVLARRNAGFWAAAVLTGTALLGAYLAFYAYQTHDALYRIHIIEQTNEFLKEGNYLLGNRAALWQRLGWLPLQFLVGTGMGLMVVLAAAALPYLRRPATNEARFWLLLTLSTLAFFWVGSTSLTHYNPITLLPRMSTPLLPPLCLAAGFGLERLLRTGRGYWAVAVALLGAAVWLRSSVSVQYALPGLYLLVAGWQARRPQGTGTAPLAAAGALLMLALTLSIRPMYFMHKPTVSAHFAQNRLIQAYLRRPNQPGTVFVDDFLLENHAFYYGYQLPAQLAYRRYWARDSVRIDAGRPAWLLLNRATLRNDELTRKLIRYSPDSVLGWYPRRRLIAQDGPVELYQVND